MREEDALGDLFTGEASRMTVADGGAGLAIAQALLELGEELAHELRRLIAVARLDEVQTIELVKESAI